MSNKGCLLVFGAGLAGLAFALPGCVVGTDHREHVVVEDSRTPPPNVVNDVGTVTLFWTVAGTTDPFACYDLGADDLEVVVYDAFGDFVLEAEAFCEDFALSIDLFDDEYFADMTLVDFADRAITVTHTIENVVIVAGTELIVDVDFPLGSFR